MNFLKQIVTISMRLSILCFKGPQEDASNNDGFMFVLFGLRFYDPVNSYGHVETVISPNHTFSWASLIKRLTSTPCT